MKHHPVENVIFTLHVIFPLVPIQKSRVKFLFELRAVKEFIRIIVRCLIKLRAVMEFVGKL